MKIEIGSLWKFKNTNADGVWMVVGNNDKKIILSGPGPCRSVRYESEDFLVRNGIELKPAKKVTMEQINFPEKYIPMLGKLRDNDLADLISAETGESMSRQKVRYWRKRNKIGKFGLIQNTEKLNTIKKYIEKNPNFTINSLKKDLGFYMINGKTITWDLILKFFDELPENEQPAALPENNVIDCVLGVYPALVVASSFNKKKIKHGYNKQCKCDLCKLSKSIYQRYYEFRNPMKIKCCEAFAFLFLSKYKEIGSREFYLFLDSIVTSDMFKYPEKA